jgi:hypothetical protein
MSSHGYGACLIEHCPNERRLRSPVCAACAQNFRYWDEKGPGAVMNRQSQLEKWQDRMQYLGNEERKFKRVAREITNRRA